MGRKDGEEESSSQVQVSTLQERASLSRFSHIQGRQAAGKETRKIETPQTTQNSDSAGFCKKAPPLLTSLHRACSFPQQKRR